ncbi:MAG TPA: hypothetical protein VFU31_17975 [Candidatus Binatia bacterium]|nr:hypothetical protein [Candidatus Binatia bacterium]
MSETKDKGVTIQQVAEKTLIAGCSKSSHRRGARKIDERRRTYAVRWSEAIERNEAYGAFSAAC